MPRSDTRVDELFRKWWDLCRQGQFIPAGEFCSEYPDLIDKLEERIKQHGEHSRHDTNGHLETTTDFDDNIETDSSPTDDDLIYTVSQFGAYRFFARGGLGEIYVADDYNFNREVALKFLRRDHEIDPTTQRRFVVEAEVTAQLEHPGVVPVYGSGFTTDGRPFQVMRFIRGDSLSKAIDRYHKKSKLPREHGEQSVEFRKLLGDFVSVCNTVAYAHNRGILHRDLKPDNVILGKYGETIVIDWGLAMSVEREARFKTGDEQTLMASSEHGLDSDSQGIAGTPSYMSPEQALGETALTPASDIYSLGALLYKLLTGETPYQGSSVRHIIHKVRGGEFPPPHEVKDSLPPALESICLKAMQHEPNARYATALELASEIERWLAGESVEVYHENWREKLLRWTRQHVRLATFAATALLAMVVSVAVILTFGRMSYERTVAERQMAHTSRVKERLDELETKAAIQATMLKSEFETLVADVKFLATQPEIKIIATEYDQTTGKTREVFSQAIRRVHSS